MDYPVLLIIAHSLGLVILLACAVAIMRLVVGYFFHRPWDDKGRISLRVIFAFFVSSLLVLAFSSGGLLAINFFNSNALPPVYVIALRAVLLAIMAASIAFLQVVGRPWLKNSRSRPLAFELDANRILALSLALGSFFSGWLMWTATGLPQGTQNLDISIFGILAFLILALWSLLAIPALVFRLLAVHLLPYTRAMNEQPTAVPAVRREGQIPLRRELRPAVMVRRPVDR